LLALLQMSWAGYQLGIGNQGIQVAYLEALHDHHLFTRDQMVAETLSSYPSYFFSLCGHLLSLMPLTSLYLLLHFLTTAAVFATVGYLSKSLFRDPWVAFVTFLLLLAGHHQALAGATLYSPGFTHTWAVFPLSLLSLGLFYRRRYLSAFALAGATANLHALEAGHLALLMGFVALCQSFFGNRRVSLLRLLLACCLFVAAAAPTLYMMATQHQQFDAEWLQLMHIRSGDHSFPSTWWAAGTPDVPRFACIMGLAALAMAFPMRPAQRRKTLLLAAGVAGLFLVGTVFTEWKPIPTIIRAQFFRSSSILMTVALIVIAHGCIGAWRLPWQSDRHRLNPFYIAMEFGSATLTALTLAVPALLFLLPIALAVALLTALITGRLAWHQSLVAGAALVVCLLAWQTIHFVIPGLPPAISWSALAASAGSITLDPRGLLLLAAIVACWILYVARLPRLLRWTAVVAALLAAGLAVPLVLPGILARRAPASPWLDAQRWARANTPVDALFLTPPQQGGFRIYSQRSVVGEMRDGTQLYFKAAFTKPWWDRMAALQPGILRDPDGKSLMAPGKPLEHLDDGQIIALAQQFNANYIVLPHSDTRSLEKVYDNGEWTIFRPQIPVVSVEAPGGVELKEEDQFLRATALPNIEKYRKSDGQIQVVDAAGDPVTGAQIRLMQTASSFNFGASLGFFQTPAVDTRADYKPPAVTPAELTQFLDCFNYSVIAFSGQWRFTEPTRGKTNYADLDRYVAWCSEHDIRPELHFVAGYAPAWAKSGDSAANLRAHAADLAKRYGDKIADFQITSDGIAIDQAPTLFALFRKNAPSARLGLSDDVRFWSSPPKSQSQNPEIAGLEDLRRLKKAGVKVDFFSIEARRPTGLWASGADVYNVLDAFAAEGVPVHITDFGVPVGVRIEGDIRDGKWTPALQAEYYERFFTLCFSHPDVEAVNVMGMGADTWLEGQGLLNEDHQPTPALEVLKRLITKKWRTDTTAALSPTGALTFRGFQGTYQLTLTSPNAPPATTTFTLAPNAPNHFIFTYTNGTLSETK
jgi:GH35 family endo-1,4-beta-xylanase